MTIDDLVDILVQMTRDMSSSVKDSGTQARILIKRIYDRKNIHNKNKMSFITDRDAKPTHLSFFKICYYISGFVLCGPEWCPTWYSNQKWE